MHEQFSETVDDSQSQGYVEAIQKLFFKGLGMLAMFMACLLVCHSPKIFHSLL